MTLLAQMWPSDRIDTVSAVWLINKGLESGTELNQYLAAQILRNNAKRLLVPPDTAEWPECVALNWKPDLPDLARRDLLVACIVCLMARPFGEWRKTRVNTFVFQLNEIWKTDPLPYIKFGAALNLGKLLGLYAETESIIPPSGPLKIQSIRSEIDSLGKKAVNKTTETFIQLASELEKWVGETSSPSRVPDGAT